MNVVRLIFPGETNQLESRHTFIAKLKIWEVTTSRLPGRNEFKLRAVLLTCETNIKTLKEVVAFGKIECMIIIFQLLYFERTTYLLPYKKLH